MKVENQDHSLIVKDNSVIFDIDSLVDIKDHSIVLERLKQKELNI